MKTETIHILLIGGTYHVKRAFYLPESDTLPKITMHPICTNKTPLAVVLERIKALNPEAHVFA